MGPGDPPEAWNLERPELVRALHRSFVDAGADIILTNTVGGTGHRPALHGLQDRVFDVSRHGALLAREVADVVDRYAALAPDLGASIVGGCCGTSAAHLAAMRAALDAHVAGERPDRARLERELGPLTSAPAAADASGARRGRRRRRAGSA